VGDAKRGVDMASKELERASYDGADYWFVDGAARRARASAMLLPNYDEYFIGYRDRSAVGNRVGHANAVIGGDGSVSHSVFVNGELVGRWKRLADRSGVVVHLSLDCRITPRERSSLEAAARKLAKFLGVPVTMRW
jgi:hypothetical protein